MEEDNNSFDNDNARYSDDYGARLRREVQEMRNERKLAEKNAKQMELHLQILQNENQSNIKQVETCKLKAMKRLRYIETFVLTQKKKNELKEQRFKELQTLRKQNNYIRTSLHNSIDIKRKDFFNKTNEEGLLSYTMKEYFKELRTFNKNEELMKNKQTVYTIRNRTSNYKQKKHNDLITKKMREIQYLEDLLVTEFKNKEQAEKKSNELNEKRSNVIRELNKSNDTKNNIQNDMEKLSLNNLYYNIKGQIKPKY